MPARQHRLEEPRRTGRVSPRAAPVQSSTRSGVKNSVHIEPTRAIVHGAPMPRRPLAASPSSSAAPSVSSRVVEARIVRRSQSSVARPGGHRQRVARQRARLVDRPGRRDLLHQVAPAAVGADRQAAADDLAERRQVGRDAEPLLRAAARHAEAGHHLVEDQQRAVRACRARAARRGTRRAAATTPMLPATGSTMTAAICAGVRGEQRARRRRRSLNGHDQRVAAPSRRSRRGCRACRASPRPSRPAPGSCRRGRGSSPRT